VVCVTVFNGIIVQKFSRIFLKVSVGFVMYVGTQGILELLVLSLDVGVINTMMSLENPKHNFCV